MNGKQLKEAGIAKVAANNESFLTLMRLQAMRICNLHGKVTVDQLRRYAAKKHIYPNHPNAWGAIFRGRRWQRIGYKLSTTRSAHHRVIGIWVLK